MSLPQQGQQYQAQPSSRDFVLPFSALHRDMLALVGGKAANLGELSNAKFPVPPGFCITTNAYALVAADAGLQRVLDIYAVREHGDAKQLTELAQAARHRHRGCYRRSLSRFALWSASPGGSALLCHG